MALLHELFRWQHLPAPNGFKLTGSARLEVTMACLFCNASMDARDCVPTVYEEIASLNAIAAKGMMSDAKRPFTPQTVARGLWPFCRSLL